MSTRGRVVCARCSDDDVQALVELDLQVSAHAWTAQAFHAILSSEHQDLLLLLASRRHAGTVERQVLAYCAFQLLAPELEIHGLAVRAEHQGQGWGRRLLRLVLDRAHTRGATTASLEVRVSNERARRLYAAEGFTEVFRRPGYYRDPAEDALILSRSLI